VVGDDGDELGDRFTPGPLGIDTSHTRSHIDSHQKNRQCVPASVDLDAIGALRSSSPLPLTWITPAPGASGADADIDKPKLLGPRRRANNAAEMTARSVSAQSIYSRKKSGKACLSLVLSAWWVSLARCAFGFVERGGLLRSDYPRIAFTRSSGWVGMP
jgi:hypothetical protein